MTENNPSKNWFRKIIAKYNELCEQLGVDNGACRSCVPLVRFDDECDIDDKKTNNKM